MLATAGMSRLRDRAMQTDANGHVDYPAGETTIGSSAFQYCTTLVSITLPSSLTSIGSYALAGRLRDF